MLKIRAIQRSMIPWHQESSFVCTKNRYSGLLTKGKVAALEEPRRGRNFKVGEN